jgi:phosphoribosylaminoimidazole-succinocarboxamide synthase
MAQTSASHLTLRHDALMSTHLPLSQRRQGKVRDVYEGQLSRPVGTHPQGTPVVVLIASDRLSAFDVVMPDGIPGKGELLTQVAAFWFDMIGRTFAGQFEHHLISTNPDDLDGLSAADRDALRGRIMLARRTQVVPIECVVRGYLAGSGWSEYRKTQRICGEELPAGLVQSAKLPEPIFTPATKEAAGHDENITFARACEIVGRERMTTLRQWSIAIYRMAHDHAAPRGILVADTKFEWGIPLDSAAASPILIDEALTPDSSRFWPAGEYEPGHDQPSFDKQYVRNYLQALVDSNRWNKEPPGPVLPEEIITHTLKKYQQASRLLCGPD